MALHDDEECSAPWPAAWRAVGGGGFPSAIKYAKVRPIRDETGLAVDFEIEGDYPKFGNNDPRVDDIAVDVVKMFMSKIAKCPDLPRIQTHHVHPHHYLQRGVRQKTGSTPDGRKGASPSLRREPHARPGQPRLRGFHDVGGEASL